MLRRTFTLRDRHGREGKVVFEYPCHPAWADGLDVFLQRAYVARGEVELATSGMRLGGLHVAEHKTEEIG